jgi:hypothetical protein
MSSDSRSKVTRGSPNLNHGGRIKGSCFVFQLKAIISKFNDSFHLNYKTLISFQKSEVI